MDRKEFIITSSLTVIGLSTFGSVVKLPNGKYKAAGVLQNNPTNTTTNSTQTKK